MSWGDRQAERRATLRAERERQLAAVEARLRWCAPGGMAAPDLLRRVAGTAWTAGATLDAMHGALRELADQGRAHQRDQSWYLGPGPRLPQPERPQRIDAHAGPESPCSAPDIGHDARLEGALAGAATGDAGAAAPGARVPPVQADDPAVTAPRPGRRSPTPEPYSSPAPCPEAPVSRQPPVVDQVLHSIRTHGPSTCRQLSERLGLKGGQVSRALCSLRTAGRLRRTGGGPGRPDGLWSIVEPSTPSPVSIHGASSPATGVDPARELAAVVAERDALARQLGDVRSVVRLLARALGIQPGELH